MDGKAVIELKNVQKSFGRKEVLRDLNMRVPAGQTFAFLGMASLTVIAAVMGRAIQQDFEYRAEPFFFTADLELQPQRVRQAPAPSEPSFGKPFLLHALIP